MLVVLGIAAPLHTPDLQVEVLTASGTPLPELAEAVSRALVAGGARVVLRGPTSGPCEQCAKVMVIESSPGVCAVEARHEQHVASTTLHLPAGSPLFDKARAIAIQARLLMTWNDTPESKPKVAAAHPPARSETKTAEVKASETGPSGWAPRPSPWPAAAPKPDSVPYLATRREPSAPPVPASAPVASVPAPVATPMGGPSASRPPEGLPSYTSRSDGKPVPRPAEAQSSARGDGKTTAIADAPPVARTPTASPESRAEAAGRLASDVTVRPTLEPSKPRWPWIPTAVGAGAAVAAGICAGISRSHYNALADREQSLDSARSEKSAGENWQTASWVLAGVAALGVGAGAVGFVTRSSNAGPLTAVATPVPGGGMVALAGSMP